MVSAAATHRAGTTAERPDRLRLAGLRGFEERRAPPLALGGGAFGGTRESLEESRALLLARLGLDVDLHRRSVRVLLVTGAT